MVWRDESQWSGAALMEFAQSFLRERLHATSSHIFRQLLIPSGGVETEKPIAERRQITAGKLPNRMLNF